MHRSTIRLLVLACLLAGAVACGDDTTTPTAPTPTPPTVTDEFSGALTVNGAVTHSFSVNRSGLITVTLTNLNPDSAAIIGLSLGTWNVAANTCQVVLSNDSATQNAVITGNAGTTGSFCARVYDVGHLGGPTDYKLTVIHY